MLSAIIRGRSPALCGAQQGAIDPGLTGSGGREGIWVGVLEGKGGEG